MSKFLDGAGLAQALSAVHGAIEASGGELKADKIPLTAPQYSAIPTPINLASGTVVHYDTSKSPTIGGTTFPAGMFLTLDSEFDMFGLFSDDGERFVLGYAKIDGTGNAFEFDEIIYDSAGGGWVGVDGGGNRAVNERIRDIYTGVWEYVGDGSTTIDGWDWTTDWQTVTYVVDGYKNLSDVDAAAADALAGVSDALTRVAEEQAGRESADDLIRDELAAKQGRSQIDGKVYGLLDAGLVELGGVATQFANVVETHGDFAIDGDVATINEEFFNGNDVFNLDWSGAQLRFNKSVSPDYRQAIDAERTMRTYTFNASTRTITRTIRQSLAEDLADKDGMYLPPTSPTDTLGPKIRALKNGMYHWNNASPSPDVNHYTDIPPIGGWANLIVQKINNDPDFGRLFLCIGTTDISARWFFGAQAGEGIWNWKEIRTTPMYGVGFDVSTDGYLLSRHDTWPANTEQSFGNNLYGIRRTGTFNWTYTVGVQELLISNHYCDVGKMVDYGGDINYAADGGITLNYGYNNSGNLPEHYSRIYRQSGYVYVYYYHKGVSGANLPYDIWYTWKKRSG
jgi:hypothetical protein